MKVAVTSNHAAQREHIGYPVESLLGQSAGGV
jgi:hypothetical protein